MLKRGVVAARAAGMKCIAVPNRHTKGNDFSQATLVVSGLDQVTLAMIESLGSTLD
jgi:beta-phosphoglucomutase-like phosphatase (HAD superfamily)